MSSPERQLDITTKSVNSPRVAIPVAARIFLSALGFGSLGMACSALDPLRPVNPDANKPFSRPTLIPTNKKIIPTPTRAVIKEETTKESLKRIRPEEPKGTPTLIPLNREFVATPARFDKEIKPIDSLTAKRTPLAETNVNNPKSPYYWTYLQEYCAMSKESISIVVWDDAGLSAANEYKNNHNAECKGTDIDVLVSADNAIKTGTQLNDRRVIRYGY